MKRKTTIVIALVAVLGMVAIGSAIATGLFGIWSPSVGPVTTEPTPAPTPSPSFTDLSINATSFKVGDTAQFIIATSHLPTGSTITVYQQTSPTGTETTTPIVSGLSTGDETTLYYTFTATVEDVYYRAAA